MSAKKVLPMLYALVVVALLAAQCAVPSPTAAPPAEQPKEQAATPTEAQPEAPAKEVFLDVGQQPPITILVNDSPWFGGFEAVVQLYEEQTGNVVNLDVTPYNGVLEKARNAVRASESPYDIINIDTGWTVEFYDGGFLTPLDEIEPGYKMPPEVLTYDDSYFWNAEKQWRTSDGGSLMTFPPNGNIQLLFYRADLYEEAGLTPPETWDDLLADCQQLQDRPNLYGFVGRGERGNAIRFAWTPFMLGYGASFVQDPENGDFTVTINSPEAKAALDTFLKLHQECGPANAGAIGQGDMIQLMTTGKAANIVSVIAAWAQMDDPEKSVVIGKVNTTLLPKPADGVHATTIGNWHFGVPKNMSDARKQAALAFAKWFLTYDAQYAYAEAGAVPVRSDVFASDLASKPEFRWMKSYLDSMPYAHQVLGYKEGAQVEEIMGLRLNQALIGELSAAQALNQAAEDLYQVFEANGRNTGKLDPLPE
jgi:multiple sugar transport system substrate-binding protein